MSSLKIAPNLDLSLDAVTGTFAILAMRGRGKTYTSSVMAEEMVGAGLPVVIVDPIGVWWGLRSSADGKKPGLPVVVLGGEHGDLPLEPTAGTVIAEGLADSPFPCVIDLSSFASKADEIRFMTDFLTRLYRVNRNPLHLIVDEADEFAPQQSFPEGKRLLGAMEQVVRRGRARGLGITLITQRPAVLNKNVLSQTDTLILLGMTGSNDLKAMDDWVGKHSDSEEARSIKATLPGLPVGTAWVWSPMAGITKRVKIRKRRTFDSSATPKVGESRIEPKQMAEVDLAALSEQIKASVEKVEAEDPKHLNKVIRDLRSTVQRLEAELARVPEPVEPERVEVEVPVLGDSDRTLLEQANAANDRLGDALQDLNERLRVNAFERAQQQSAPTQSRRDPLRQRGTVIEPPAPSGEGSTLKKAERSILTVLAQHGHPDGYDVGIDQKRLALLAGYTVGGGGYNNALGSLRTSGRIERGNPVKITTEGLSALGDYEPLPRGRALMEHHSRHLGKAHREILDVLYEAYPQGLTKEEIAEKTVTGYAPGGGGFANALGRLRALHLIETHDGRTVLAEEMIEEY